MPRSVLRCVLGALVTTLVFADSTGFAQPPAGAQGDVSLLLGTINAERLADHLRPLQLDERLCRVAYEHAMDMLRRGYFSHSTPEGADPKARLQAAHVPFGYLGENLGLDQNARLVSRDLWLSSEHRSNLLGPFYRRIGIAAVRSPQGTLVVEDFSD